MASDQQTQGLRAKLVFDRATASRLGITPSAIDQTLYDAYGQRQVSTMFTQLNQYHVVLEVKPDFSRTRSTCAICTSARAMASAAPRRAGLVSGGSAATQRLVRRRRPSPLLAQRLHGVQRARFDGIASAARFGVAPQSSTAFPNGGQVPLSAFHATGDDHAPDHGQPPGPVPGDHAFLQSGPNASLGDAVDAVNKVKDETGHAGQHSGAISRHGRGVSGFAGERADADSGGAGDGLHRAGRAVRKLHPSDHDSFDAAFGGRGRAACADPVQATISA